MDSKHTSTPWEVCDAHGPIKNGSCVKAVADDKMICSTTGYYGREGAIANAAFIVRACNSHDQLVEAVKRLLGCMSLAGWEGDVTADFARAALAAAEAQQ